MTSFADNIGFITITKSDNNSFYKIYKYINLEHWLRIQKVSLILSKENIGPRVKTVKYDNSNEKGIIEYEKVTPFITPFQDQLEGKNKEEISKEITVLVKKLHSLGYAHGDLVLNNIGYKKDKFFLLDHDTVYKINKDPPDWLEMWMKEGFDWDESFEKFIEYDYKNWTYDLFE